MGKSSGSQTVSQDPWGPAQGNLKLGLSELARIYGGGGMAPTREQFTTAPTYGGPGSYQQGTGAWMPGTTSPGGFDQGGYDRALAAYQAHGAQATPVHEYGLLDPAAAQLMSTIRGDNLFSNPNLDEVIRRASTDVNSQFERGSRYGSGSHMDQLFSQAAAPLRYQDYSRERQNQLSAVQAAPGFEMAPYQLYSARQAAPYEGVRNFLDLSNQVAGRGGTQSSPIYRNPLAGAAGGAALGAGIGSLFAAPGAAGVAAVGGWPFLLGGALLGGLS